MQFQLQLQMLTHRHTQILYILYDMIWYDLLWFVAFEKIQMLICNLQMAGQLQLQNKFCFFSSFEKNFKSIS